MYTGFYGLQFKGAARDALIISKLAKIGCAIKSLQKADMTFLLPSAYAPFI
jgi:hypothetical protein